MQQSRASACERLYILHGVNKSIDGCSLRAYPGVDGGAAKKKITIDQEIPPSHSLRAYNRHVRDIVYPDVYESIDGGGTLSQREMDQRNNNSRERLYIQLGVYESRRSQKKK